MMIKDCLFCKLGDNQDETFVKDFGKWVYRVSPKQFLLGVGVLVYKEHVEGLTSLSEMDMIDAYRIINKIETALKKAFSPDWFNYLQTNNSVRHFHFHIIPRYKSNVSFEGENFIDQPFTGMPVESNRVLPKEVMTKIIMAIRQNL